MRAGFEPDAFWDQTSRTLAIAYEAKRLAGVDAHNARMTLAWHVAALQRTARLPPLRKLLVSAGHRGFVRQTPEQMLAIATLYVAAKGGEIKRLS